MQEESEDDGTAGGSCPREVRVPIYLGVCGTWR